MMEESFKLWEQLEREAKTELYRYFLSYVIIQFDVNIEITSHPPKLKNSVNWISNMSIPLIEI